MNIKLHPDLSWSDTNFSEQQIKRMKDREEWARKAEAQYQERMKVLKEHARSDREQVREQVQDISEYATMVQKMLQELYDQNPEWEERRRKVQQVRPIVCKS
jgi:DnaJ family protein C protein 17